MREIDASTILQQMRVLAARAGGTPQVEEGARSEVSFGALLKSAVDQVATQQAQAQALQTKFESGARDIDVADVMLAMQKASLSFQAMNQVRNRLVSAYQDIMNMQI